MSEFRNVRNKNPNEILVFIYFEFLDDKMINYRKFRYYNLSVKYNLRYQITVNQQLRRKY